MKIFLVLLCLAVAAHAMEEVTKFVLNSPRETVQLWSSFKSKRHLKFGRRENLRRFRQFKRNAKLVADANDESDSATFALNQFSSMTKAEKLQYRGLNITGHFANPPMLSSGQQSVAPATKLWTAEGAVTAVKNQGSCGSCWTWGAIAGLETRYKNIAGKLRKFSEQEYLDCVYEGSRDGCNGGWPDDGYEYSKKRGGQLAAASQYAYTAKDSTCQTNKGNALISAVIDGVHKVGGTEAENIAALSQGSLSVAFEVTDKLQQYSKGIMKDTTCSGSPNHAVGYTPEYVLVKNSWGDQWGEKGFIRFARNHGNCGLFKYSSYPILKETGKDDNGDSDAAAAYTPGDNSSADDSSNSGGGNSSCKDKAVDCESWMCEWSSLANVMKEYCQKTCKHCTDNGGACASGTVRCSDGVCRHSHMCNH